MARKRPTPRDESRTHTAPLARIRPHPTAIAYDKEGREIRNRGRSPSVVVHLEHPELKANLIHLRRKGRQFVVVCPTSLCLHPHIASPKTSGIPPLQHTINLLFRSSKSVFSRHDYVRASSTLFVWLNENVLFPFL